MTKEQFDRAIRALLDYWENPSSNSLVEWFLATNDLTGEEIDDIRHLASVKRTEPVCFLTVEVP